MEEERVQLEVMGISYTPLQSGAFALLLAQVDGPYRIPMVIGATEAQSIAIRLEGIVTPRPITHDLFSSLAHAFSLELKEVYIYKFENGIFYSEMKFTDGIKEATLESRASDAIAIAMRTGAPIYTTKAIMHLTGTILESKGSIDDDSAEEESASSPHEASSSQSLEDMTDDQLKEYLDRLIAEENYEKAAQISEIIKNRKK